MITGQPNRSIGMDLSLVLPIYNGADRVAAQLEALAGQTFAGSWELVIADNGSTDRLAEAVAPFRDRLPLIRLVDASERRGCGAAKNVGVAQADSQMIVICDDDDLVCPTYLEAHLTALASSPLVAGAVRIVSEPTGPVRWDEGFSTSPPIEAGYRPFAFGCNMGFHRDLFDRVGGFDEAIRFGEDVSFCWDAQALGCDLGFAPEAKVLKAARSELGAAYRQHVNFGRSVRQLELKHGGDAARCLRRSIVGYLGSTLRIDRLVRSDARAFYVRRVGRLVGYTRERVRPTT